MRSHRTLDCESIRSCTKPRCTEHHHALLHPERENTDKEPADYDHLPATTVDGKIQIAHARLHGPSGNNMIVGCLLDSDFYRSFVKKSVADALNLEGPIERIFVESFCGNYKKYNKAQRVKLWVSSLDGKGDKNSWYNHYAY
ncbi:putative malate:quinone oxidoreductase [Trichinella spiralis]|uniref:Malate:quinone oxidoreductase n=1 Tax=Trichinella spiralis TaxID=6334 RepID=A0ABR3K5A9_TRISP